jgi:hypothetical protein
MLIEEEEVKNPVEVSPDALEAVFAEDDTVAEEVDVLLFGDGDDEQVDEIDIAFQANDEGYW